ncbi:hypothetical protein EMCRGX_G009731 [Ephydatia muelleri]
MSESMIGEIQFVDEVPQELICSICLEPAKDPQQTSCKCSRLYCSECIQRLMQTSGICPTCRKTLRAFPDGLSTRRLRSLRVKCSYSHTGCMWVNEWAALGDHIKTCTHASVSCAQCREKVFRDSLSTHMLSTCGKRRHTCPHCKQEGTHEHITGKHLVECTDVMIRCPRSGCEVTAKRRDMESHSAKCPKVQIACPYTKVGCTFACLREHMPVHVKEAIQDHLDKAITALQLSRSVVVRLPEFSKKKEANHVWYSPGFYTHFNGYKVCISVYPNGHLNAKSTHLSVFISLMSGENDDNLVWPLRATFTVTLLNQIRDANHRSHVFTIDEKHNKCKVLGDSPGPGIGYTTFAALSELNLDEAKQCQYLRGDTLYFRVESDVSLLCKPWLTSIN